MDSLTRVRILIRGAVQGVGFRPFVYRLATALHLTGWVSNSSEGVQIEAEGPTRSSSTNFLFASAATIRIMRRFTVSSIHSSTPSGSRDFQIRQSESKGAKRVLILPDIATCRDCLRDVFDPANRRYLYPFTNCTNCGPRFTIIESLPYDRANTTMRDFEMCSRCRAEYEDPHDRRFHAQPNACPECGPQLELWDATGTPIADRDAAIAHAVKRVEERADCRGERPRRLSSDGGCGQRRRQSCGLRNAKHREEKPFAVMVPSIEVARELCCSNSLEERVLTAPESPIVLLSSRAMLRIAPSVAPGNPYLGVMLPYTPLHHILMRQDRNASRCDQRKSFGRTDRDRRTRGDSRGCPGIADLLSRSQSPDSTSCG